VFIDYQNAYRGAREAFGESAARHIVGQFDPLKTARQIFQRHPSYAGARLRRLDRVQTYRGMASSADSPERYASARSQVNCCRRVATTDAPRLDVHTRPLDYRTGKPRENGIDVLLASDLAFGAAVPEPVQIREGKSLAEVVDRVADVEDQTSVVAAV